MRLEMGASVRCEDDVLGELADVVIDPTTKRVTHLVVEPHHEIGPARLVPIDFAQEGDGQQISLRCMADEVRRLAPVHEFAYLRPASSLSTIRIGTWAFSTCLRCLTTSLAST